MSSEADWFSGARRALAVARPICAAADDLVVISRSALEAALALHAKGLFVTRELHAQLALLLQVADALRIAADDRAASFSASLVELDAAGARLNEVLERLQHTPVDAAFKPQHARDHASTAITATTDTTTDAITTASSARTTAPAARLKAQLRDAIYFFQTSHRAALDDLENLDLEIADLSSALSNLGLPGASDSAAASSAKALVACFSALDSESRAMGSLLESLAHHYDQCAQAATGEDADDDADPSTCTTEHANMLAVLRDDAAQVDDVVSEIEERHSAMLIESERIFNFFASACTHYAAAAALCEQYSEYSGTIKLHMHASREFADNVSRYFSQRNMLLEQLDALVRHFDEFAHSYDALVLEVVRRHNTQIRMEKVVHDALDHLQVIYNEEMTARSTFRSRHADFLPADLWPGLTDPPIGYEILACETSPLPDLPRALIDQVKQRFIATPMK
ncbi:autophagy-related protein 17 [Limtongia smithiae]|uniref:autophagy-related protein 17 n=1 Tax=Limtongia smithiae TaxID=1125753 RepID=UPI0034CD38DA